MNPLQLGTAVLAIVFPLITHAGCEEPSDQSPDCAGKQLAMLENVTIFGTAPSARDVAGGANANLSHAVRLTFLP